MSLEHEGLGRQSVNMSWRARCGLPLAAGLAASLVMLAAAHASETGPPRGISAGAAIYWNVDALVRDNFGDADVCVEHYNVVLRARSSYCSVYYTRLFPAAHHSAFRLVVLARNPVAAVNVLPIRFFRRSGPYVSCGAGRWLALTNGRSQLWPVDCVKP
jgi:hypothetical protein